MDLSDAQAAFRLLNWNAVLEMSDGETFGVILDGQHHTVTKVHSEDKEDNDYDRRLVVVVEVSGQYFRKEGYANVGSHCYGEYEPSWDALTEVRPETKPVTFWV